MSDPIDRNEERIPELDAWLDGFRMADTSRLDAGVFRAVLGEVARERRRDRRRLHLAVAASLILAFAGFGAGLTVPHEQRAEKIAAVSAPSSSVHVIRGPVRVVKVEESDIVSESVTRL